MAGSFERSWYVSLAGVFDPEITTPTIAHEVGIAPEVTLTAERAITAFLADRQCLLVLDNFEHILAATDQVMHLLTACPHLTILVTSRIPLNLSAEFIYLVPPLPLAPRIQALDLEAVRKVDTVRLFVDRATARHATFALTAQNATDVAAICRRLDGLPLAIELVAARLPVLPIPAILAQLDGSIALLAGGPRDAPTRQRTMDDTIAWSYDLLSPAQRTLFRRLSTFAGGLTVKAAAAITDSSGAATLAGITDLVTANLMVPVPTVTGAARFAMLDTIRAFAFERLTETPEAAAIRDSHAHYFMSQAEAAIPLYDGPELDAAMAAMDLEMDNSRAALAWSVETGDRETSLRLAGALWRVWVYPSPKEERSWFDRVPEARSWLELALENRDGLPVATVTEALVGAVQMAYIQEDISRAVQLGTELGDRAASEHDAYGTYWAVTMLGRMAALQGDNGTARRHLEHALSIAPTIRDADNQRAFTLQWLGILEMQTGNTLDAVARLEESLGCARSCGNPIALAWSLVGLADAVRDVGELARSVNLGGEAFTLFHSFNGEVGMRVTLISLSLNAIQAGQHARAMRLLRTASRCRILAQDEADFRNAVTTLREAVGRARFDGPWAMTEPVPFAGVPGEIDDLVADLRAPKDGAPEGCTVSPLTPREREVLRLVAEGLSNRAIGESLSISERTVENHVMHLLTKLDLPSRTAAAAYAVRHGLD
jgi:predicted ATPase/DNA-binding CsgD family transcriptional regulator